MSGLQSPFQTLPIYKIPLNNRVFQFIIMQDIKERQNQEHNEYHQKQKDIEQQEQDHKVQCTEDDEEHYNEVHQSFML